MIASTTAVTSRTAAYGSDACLWLADGRVEFDRPTCGDQLLVDIEDPQGRWKPFFDGSRTATAVTPVEPSPATVEAGLLGLARADNRPTTVGKLLDLFGSATCPRCHALFDIPHALC